jgi:prephenate dehydrogenase
LLEGLLPPQCEPLIHDPSPSARSSRGRLTAFEEAASAAIVVFCVPVQALEEALQHAAPFVQPGAWVMDVASVKTLPAQWMARHLPPHCAITATHPLFGPQSARRGLAGQRLVICPVRGARDPELEVFARSHGLDVIYSTPQDHDREMAHVQALTHLIGRALVRTGRPELILTTQSYEHLRDLSRLIEHDSDALFAAIQSFNPYAQQTVDRFRAEIAALMAGLGRSHQSLD